MSGIVVPSDDGPWSLVGGSRGVFGRKSKINSVSKREILEIPAITERQPLTSLKALVDNRVRRNLSIMVSEPSRRRSSS